MLSAHLSYFWQEVFFQLLSWAEELSQTQTSGAGPSVAQGRRLAIIGSRRVAIRSWGVFIAVVVTMFLEGETSQGFTAAGLMLLVYGGAVVYTARLSRVWTNLRAGLTADKSLALAPSAAIDDYRGDPAPLAFQWTLLGCHQWWGSILSLDAPI